MKKVLYIFGVIVLLVVVILGYTYWYNKDPKTEVSVEADGVSLLGDTFGIEEIAVSVKGTLTSAKLDTGGIFLGEISFGETIITMDSENGGLRIDSNQDILYGSMMTSEGESIMCVFSTDFTAGYFRNNTTGAYLYYPYQGERLMEVKGLVEGAFDKLPNWRPRLF